MSKQTFTTGQVLTAAQMTSLQQTAMGGGSTTAKVASYVLVAADAGTVVQMNAAGATTITVNTALFAAGDSVQIQNIGAGVCTVTAGTATVSTAGSLALSQYEGGQLYFNTTSAALFFDIVQSSGMTNPLTTTGDIIYSSSGSTPARLGIGTTGQVVTVASGIPSWTTPSAGAMVLVKAPTTFTNVAGTSTTFDNVFSATYKTYCIVIQNIFSAGGVFSDDLEIQLRYGGVTQAASYWSAAQNINKATTVTVYANSGAGVMTISQDIGDAAIAGVKGQFWVDTFTTYPSITGMATEASGNEGFISFGGSTTQTRTYDGFLLKSSSSNVTGTVAVYGLVES